MSLRHRLGLPAAGGRRTLLAAMLVDSLGSGLFLPFTVVYFLQTTSLGLPTIGAALSLAELATMAGLPIYGRLLDRLGPRALVVIGNSVSALGFVGFLAVHNQAELVLFAALVDCGSGLFWTANPALLSLAADPGERSLWFGLSRVLRNGGIGLGALAAAALVTVGGSQGLRLIALANAASFMAAAVLVGWWRWAPPWRAPQALAPPRMGRRSGYMAVVRDRSFMRLMAANLVFVLCGDSLTLLLAVYVSRDLGEPLVLAGALFAANTALVVLLQTTVTRLVDRVARTRILRWAAVVWGVSLLLLGALSAAPPALVVPGLLVAIAIFTVAEMLESPAMSDLIVSTHSGSTLGRYLGVHQVSWALGAASAPILFTWLLGRGPLWPWLVLTGSCLAAMLVLKRLDFPRVAGPA